MIAFNLLLSILTIFTFSNCFVRTDELSDLLKGTLTPSEITYGYMRGKFGSPKLDSDVGQLRGREGRKLSSVANSRLWPHARVPYEFAKTIDHQEWLIMQRIFSNISSVTNLEFIPRTARDLDYLYITEDIETFGCGCCSIGVGYLEGSGPHVLVLAPVSEGGCGVNHIGGTHELLHILGLAHVQNRADRCNYIDVDTSRIQGWGEWQISQLTPAADWFKLRIPYDCSSYVHYYQLQGAVWKEDVMKKVDQLMESQGCEDFQRGRFINKCLVSGGYTDGNRVTRSGYDSCLDQWDKKHKACVETVIERFPTFHLVDPNGRCKENGINKQKRESYQISQWDIWALNAAYGGPLPACQYPSRKGNGVCDIGNNNLGCDYDGGDCCLPEARAKDCIDPCGVRLKFYNGTNRRCSPVPETENFCRDHYWYGPNKCGPKYCSSADENYLQWQCKKTCNLCNIDPSRSEMDEICDNYLSPAIKNKYKVSAPNIEENNEISPDVGAISKPAFILGGKNTNSKPKTTAGIANNKRGQKNNRTQPKKTTRPSQNILSKTQRKEKTSKTSQRKPAETVRSSGSNTSSNEGKTQGGFVVINDPERRKALRSYWMRRG